jgi:hypothetical protein
MEISHFFCFKTDYEKEKIPCSYGVDNPLSHRGESNSGVGKQAYVVFCLFE